MGPGPHLARESDAAGALQREGLLRHRRLPAPCPGAPGEDRTRRAAVSIPGERDWGIRAPLSQSQGSRLGPGRAAQHGRAEVRAAEDSRSAAEGRDLLDVSRPERSSPAEGYP